jgi:hypothetical protein
MRINFFRFSLMLLFGTLLCILQNHEVKNWSVLLYSTRLFHPIYAETVSDDAWMYDFVVEAGSVIQYAPFFLLVGLYPMFVSLFA